MIADRELNSAEAARVAALEAKKAKAIHQIAVIDSQIARIRSGALKLVDWNDAGFDRDFVEQAPKLTTAHRLGVSLPTVTKYQRRWWAALSRRDRDRLHVERNAYARQHGLPGHQMPFTAVVEASDDEQMYQMQQYVAPGLSRLPAWYHHQTYDEVRDLFHATQWRKMAPAVRAAYDGLRQHYRDRHADHLKRVRQKRADARAALAAERALTPQQRYQRGRDYLRSSLYSSMLTWESQLNRGTSRLRIMLKGRPMLSHTAIEGLLDRNLTSIDAIFRQISELRAAKVLTPADERKLLAVCAAYGLEAA